MNYVYEYEYEYETYLLATMPNFQKSTVIKCYFHAFLINNLQKLSLLSLGFLTYLFFLPV